MARLYDPSSRDVSPRLGSDSCGTPPAKGDTLSDRGGRVDIDVH